jgi:peptidyl-tRNA hydrolase
VLECEDQAHLMHIAKYCEQWNICHHLYIDEGLTEVFPLTATCLATGLIHEDDDWMFKEFKLYTEKKK